jgi:hypothetical protein
MRSAQFQSGLDTAGMNAGIAALSLNQTQSNQVQSFYSSRATQRQAIISNSTLTAEQKDHELVLAQTTFHQQMLGLLGVSGYRSFRVAANQARRTTLQNLGGFPPRLWGP